MCGEYGSFARCLKLAFIQKANDTSGFDKASSMRCKRSSLPTAFNQKANDTSGFDKASRMLCKRSSLPTAFLQSES